jgi:hypothetical protein
MYWFVNLKFTVLKNLMPPSLIKLSRRFERKFSLHVDLLPIPLIKAKCWSEKFIIRPDNTVSPRRWQQSSQSSYDNSKLNYLFVYVQRQIFKLGSIQSVALQTVGLGSMVSRPWRIKHRSLHLWFAERLYWQLKLYNFEAIYSYALLWIWNSTDWH